MGNKRLRRYALIAEIVSAAAVVVSLVFVAFQVQENTDAIRSATYDGILSDHIEWRMTVATNFELAEAMSKVGSGDTEVSKVERENANDAGRALWQIYERAFFARKYETLGDSEWDRYERAICRRAPLHDFDAEFERYLTSEFVEVAASCDPSECVRFFGDRCRVEP